MNKTYYEEMVKGPGKFEGEPPWTPYFWELVMNGDGESIYDDSDDENREPTILYDKFTINSNDVEIFPELAEHHGKEIRVREDSQGFVYSKIHRETTNDHTRS